MDDRIRFQEGSGTFPFAIVFTPALVPTQPSTQWVSEVKRSGREADHSSPSSAAVKNKWVYTFTPPCVQDVVLSSAQDTSSGLVLR
jgi:hypothetical protein